MYPTFQEAQFMVLDDLLVLVKLCRARLTFKWSNSKAWLLRVDINQGLCFTQEHVLILLYATSLLKLLHRREPWIPTPGGHTTQWVHVIHKVSWDYSMWRSQAKAWMVWMAKGNKGQDSKLPIIWAGKPATRTRFHLGTWAYCLGIIRKMEKKGGGELLKEKRGAQDPSNIEAWNLDSSFQQTRSTPQTDNLNSHSRQATSILTACYAVQVMLKSATGADQGEKETKRTELSQSLGSSRT